MEIINLNDANLDSYDYYFLDTNVWIAFLRYNFDSNESNTYKYVTFIEDIMEHNENRKKQPSKVQKKIPEKKIILSSLLLSEILNTAMREIYMKNYFTGNSYKSKNFKNDYRNNVQSDYSDKIEILSSDLISFQNHIEQINDSFGSLNYCNILQKQIKSNIDFNDDYFLLALQNSNLEKCCIITDDADFNSVTCSLPIITLNKNLIRGTNK